MRIRILTCGATALLLAIACEDDKKTSEASVPKKDAGHAITKDASSSANPTDEDSSVARDALSFFVTSDRSMTGDLGGLSGADARCQKLATAVGAGSSSWHAYLSVEHDPANHDQPTYARTRIGDGPWVNANGVVVAQDVDALHARTGDVEVFLDEHGEKIPGQWAGSPPPVEHDVLTGSTADGMVLAGQTCKDWTSSSASDTAQVGHTDGLGPMMNPAAPYSSWNSSHANGGCNDTAPRGGAGRLYCFASD